MMLVINSLFTSTPVTKIILLFNSCLDCYAAYLELYGDDAVIASMICAGVKDLDSCSVSLLTVN